MWNYWCLLELFIILGSSVVKGEVVELCPEKEKLSIRCPANEVIVFQSASWGRTSSYVCRQYSPNGTCTFNHTLAVLAKLCFKQNTCDIFYQDANTIFKGNPCGEYTSQLVVDYLCIRNSDIYGICDTRNSDIKQPLGFIHSKSYPNNYPLGSYCNIRLAGRQGQIMRITMLYLNMKYSSLTHSCYDSLVFIKTDNRPYAYQFCDPDQVNYDMVTNEGSHMFTWTYNLQNVTFVQVSFESSQFDDHPDRGFLFKFELEGCANDDVPIPPNARSTTFESSKRVIYTCEPGYQMVRPGTGFIQCDGQKWIGDPGECIQIVIDDKSTTTTANPSAVNPSLAPANTSTTTTAIESTTIESTTTSTTMASVSDSLARTSATMTSATVTTTTNTSSPTTPTTTTTTSSTTATTSLKTSLPTTLPTTLPGKTTALVFPPSPVVLSSTAPSTASTPVPKTSVPVVTKLSPLTSTASPPSDLSTTPEVIATTNNTVNASENVGLNLPPTPPPITPNDTTGTTVIVPVDTVKEDDNNVWTVTAIGLSVGVIGIILLFLLILFAFTRRRRNKKKKKRDEQSPITSLRPSSHACVSIPNSYGGNIGYGVPKDTSLRSKNYISTLDDGDTIDDDTIEVEKRKNKVKLNNNVTFINSKEENGKINSREETRDSKISDISYQSSLYEAGHGGRTSTGSDGISVIPEETSGITPDYYVERTGYAAGTTGFINSDERFPEVHFVEVNNETIVDSMRLENLEPIAEETQLHHGDILNTNNSQNSDSAPEPENRSSIISNDTSEVVTETSFDETNSRNSGGSSHFSFGLATIHEEGRPAGDGEEERNSEISEESGLPIIEHRTDSVVKTPYSRTSLEGTRIPRGTLKRIANSKAPYPLFKDDDTGNLENYLEDRRGSY